MCQSQVLPSLIFIRNPAHHSSQRNFIAATLQYQTLHTCIVIEHIDRSIFIHKDGGYGVEKAGQVQETNQVII